MIPIAQGLCLLILEELRDGDGKNMWGFNLHSRVRLHQGYFFFTEKLEEKKIVGKDYGRKILYVTELQKRNSALIFRSKFLKYVEIRDNKIITARWKSIGNLIIFGAWLEFRGNNIWRE